MPNDTHYFELNFKYSHTDSNKANCDTTLAIKKDSTDTTIALDGGTSLKCKVQVVYTTFNRKVYAPNEIVADVCFSSDEIKGHLDIFFRSKVELVRISNSSTLSTEETFTGFYVYNALPLKVPGTDIYIRFHIFSLDHQLTIKKYSRTYLAKKLGADILAGISATQGTTLDINKVTPLSDNNTSLKTLKFPLSDNGKNLVVVSDLDRLKFNSTEPLQPYLVQYNESFYDFMVRTANRCGEFFFWDDGALRLGRSCKIVETLTVDSSDKSKNDADCTVYYNNTNTNTEYATDYYTLDDLSRDKDLLSTVTKADDLKSNVDTDGDYLCFGNDKTSIAPDPANTTSYYYNNEVNHDVYRTRLYKDRFNSLYNVTVNNAAKYMTSFVSLLLNETNLYDFLKKFILTKVLSTTAAKAQLDNANKIGNKSSLELNYRNDSERKLIVNQKDRKGNNKTDKDGNIKTDIVYANLYSNADIQGHLTNKYFYSVIRQNEESLSRQLITFSTPNPKALRLGQSISYNSTNYTIIQIKMKLGTNDSKFSKIDAAAEAEFKDMGSSMEVVAIPEAASSSSSSSSSSDVTSCKANVSTVYPPLHPAGHVRRSEPQVAFVSDFLDPQKRGRVRIKYPWQSAFDTDASPWIRVLTPSATPDSGCIFALSKGDEVLVDYESHNIERPYVAGTLYNKNNHTPFTRGDMALISKNGHGIAFNNPIDVTKFVAGISPTWAFVNQFLALNTSKLENSLKLTGGTTISDAYGFYKIAMSTDQRRIDISSPFGKVNIDAFQGINISAPNGDINIKGQNINIEAGNSIKVTSGTNITKKRDWVKTNEGGWGALKNVLNSVGGAVLDFVSPIAQPVDLDLLRKILQVFLRPIDGTLEIKSNQYLLLEAGNGEAVVQRDRYQAGHAPDTSKYNKARTFMNKVVESNADLVALEAVINKISVCVDEVIRGISTLQKDVKAKKTAFEKARKDALSARKIENACIQSNAIIGVSGGGAVDYGDGTHDGDFHFTATALATDKTALETKASELSTAAYDFLVCNNRSGELINKTNTLVVNDSDSRTTYYDKLSAVIGTNFNTISGLLDDAAHFDSCNLSRADIKALRKKIKHKWFNLCYSAIHAANNKFKIGAGHTDYNNWDDYVKFLTYDDNTGELSFADKAVRWAAPLANLGLQYSDAIVDVFCDRNHWEAGKTGQILFSDRPQQSIYFDLSGETRTYINEWTHFPLSFAKLKAMLSDL